MKYLLIVPLFLIGCAQVVPEEIHVIHEINLTTLGQAVNDMCHDAYTDQTAIDECIQTITQDILDQIAGIEL